MAYFEEGSEAMVALEAMVDKVGMRNVVWALARIAGMKADHIISNWQDPVTGKAWEMTAHKLNRWAESINVE